MCCPIRSGSVSNLAGRYQVRNIKLQTMQASEKPEGDKYCFTHFAHKLMSSKGLNPLASDARRRADRFALEVCTFDIQHTFPILNI